MLKRIMLYKLQHISYFYVFFSCCYYKYVTKCNLRTISYCCSGYTDVGGRCKRKHLLFVNFPLLLIDELVNLTGSNTCTVNTKSILKFTTTSFPFFVIHFSLYINIQYYKDPHNCMCVCEFKYSSQYIDIV